MTIFLMSVVTIGIAAFAEGGHYRAIVLGARYLRPVPVTGGILVVLIASAVPAAALGTLMRLSVRVPSLPWVTGAVFLALSLWSSKRARIGEDPFRPIEGHPFLGTVASFSLAEMGGKAQLATLALAATLGDQRAVVFGSITGELIAILPIALIGSRGTPGPSLKVIRWTKSLVFALLGLKAVFQI